MVILGAALVAFDIAGSGKADPSSLAAALRLAAQLRRNELAA
jgi:4-hydroxy-L-threonine phosphate dehydrogenase PdxA